MKEINYEETYDNCIAIKSEIDHSNLTFDGILERHHFRFIGVSRNGRRVMCTYQTYSCYSEEMTAPLLQKVKERILENIRSNVLDIWRKGEVKGLFYWEEGAKEYYFTRIKKYEQIH